MKRILTITAAALLATSFTVTAASARKTQHSHKSSRTMSAPAYGNAAMSGNNGNSGQGDNSLGHVKGGNAGGDK